MILRGRNTLYPVTVLLVSFACSCLHADTDLEVTYIGRTPKYQSYQGHVSYYSNRTFYDDYTPYRVEASTDDYGGSMTWTVVDDNVPSGGAVTTWEDINTPTSGKKFYRACIKDGEGIVTLTS